MSGSVTYIALVRVISALLYAYDPDGMGLSASAPEDEYDEPARGLILSAVKKGTPHDIADVVRVHYPAASRQLCEAIASAVLLYKAGQASGIN